MSSLIQKMAATREKTLAAAKALPEPEEIYLTGLFDEEGELCIDEPQNAPLFSGHKWFVIDNDDHDPARRTPTHKIVSCPLRVDDKGKPIPASPVSSHAYEIGAIWHMHGEAGEISPVTGKPYAKSWDTYNGNIVNYNDEESVLLAQSGNLMSRDCKKLSLRLQFANPGNRAAKIKKAVQRQLRPEMTPAEKQELEARIEKDFPIAMFWVEKVLTEEKKAELASKQAEASGKVGNEEQLVTAGVQDDIAY